MSSGSLSVQKCVFVHYTVSCNFYQISEREGCIVLLGFDKPGYREVDVGHILLGKNLLGLSQLTDNEGMLRLASLIVILLVSATKADFECPDDTSGIFPDPDDCRGYYEGGLGTTIA